MFRARITGGQYKRKEKRKRKKGKKYLANAVSALKSFGRRGLGRNLFFKRVPSQRLEAARVRAAHNGYRRLLHHREAVACASGLPGVLSMNKYLANAVSVVKS
ncbi:MAG: hypothetical protein Q4D98_14705, partial [Planctomycetia bacterium]|nr:hypothetical protein [Planctomycetia bacterium]